MLIGRQNQALRGPVNPLDKSTIFSIYPDSILVINHTVQPGRFHIEAGSYDNPSRLVIGPSSWFRDVDENQPPLEIPHSSVQMADSIVNDWSNGLLGCDMTNNKPGLFWLPGNVSIESLKKDFKGTLDEAKQKQTNWFAHLVKMADGFWARTNGNPLSISDQMRLAARSLKLDNKEWVSQAASYELISCRACGNFIKSNLIVCPNCKVILDQKRFSEEKFQFAS